MTTIIYLAYLVAAVLFILGIKGLTKPKTAVRGNQLSAMGMFIAVVVTLFDQSILSYEWIIAGVLLGGTIGAVMATKIKVTDMPQMVALLNGFGGGASLAIAAASFLDPTAATSMVALISIGATIIIGAVTLSGSFVAFAKLQELISGNPIKVPGNKILNALLLITAFGLAIALVINPANVSLMYALVAVAVVLGVLLVVPIGGADMPVVIALLNSYSGIAAATTGFITGNTVLIISGSLVGASGIILTQIMCKAMNRSLFNVLFGVMAEGGEKVDADEIYAGKVKSTSPDEIAMMLETAERVVIVPGYGLAMAQAQHAVRELANVLQERGVDVKYAIHPVAGRMPGHMNVLLAEAEVPYEQLVEMDEINPQFAQTDVAIVIGANDVTNPMAREDKGSPIYGMPILNVDKARTVVVIKRSLSPGFAGLPNPLFAMDNALMLFGDGKKGIVELTQSLKEAD
ncbi:MULTISPECIES: NAD(P)(+) transhydrogenase (Re/Si-specific) subunit beta [unclassified Shewanella]|uniref:NAD(P)(+) transhydrogenase (Re/Si-specific) subunit beta n=1 Tax=unclassified Shewanella TaxID=196818 RepID=UPI0009707E53|nr:MULTISPECIES: NAD(P)(+) transhydrogenase (Re/Si-specific) subunit beta [unclassified Shewanella]MDO6617931.1 NAD(P)(+) transhydrogenase (Re/Si-specific) subunit beta [Shewanella sp. 6_MG-2023]MDO6639943.1 NAD(P)(+) transhydrogenase (Re/Si-specific) subunit beta [Shewanella sp. 5_MG-2023]MDO6678291.1 NAD(P)(+) transhydrogenase (Re/Si-specific) subunit beta [Shewanella sp. 4_MG-2023]MDO6775584.1 NAD(P)(+) transhydrogenase (Re/Si-specific) subunit beta [Shewanella sp. 3_MG-2023]PMG28137.1 NAD 